MGLPEMTPERLDYIEDCARRTHWLDDGDGKRTLVEASREDVRDLCAEIRRLTAERDAAVAQAQASGQAEATLRGALERAPFPWIEATRAALATPQTAHAKLAAARAEVCDWAHHVVNDEPPNQDAYAFMCQALEDLAAAEKEAGVGGDA